MSVNRDKEGDEVVLLQKKTASKTDEDVEEPRQKRRKTKTDEAVEVSIDKANETSDFNNNGFDR